MTKENKQEIYRMPLQTLHHYVAFYEFKPECYSPEMPKFG